MINEEDAAELLLCAVVSTQIETEWTDNSTAKHDGLHEKKYKSYGPHWNRIDDFALAALTLA